MKFTLALIAALAPLLASSQRIESPHGCYSESTEFAGADGDVKISDINTLTGLDAYKAKLSKIVFCR